MAKYKFTKTYRFSEGICVDADGTVTPIPQMSVNEPQEKIIIHRVSKKLVRKSPQKFERKKKKFFTKQKVMREASVWIDNNRDFDLCRKKPSSVIECKATPIMTISLNHKANPYYYENLQNLRNRAKVILPTRGALGGVYILKPINKIAAGSFKKQ